MICSVMFLPLVAFAVIRGISECQLGNSKVECLSKTILIAIVKVDCRGAIIFEGEEC